MLPDFYIIGHEGLTPEEFFRLLMENDITLLIDVRMRGETFPIEPVLKEYANKYNYCVDYEWFRVLGNPFKDRDNWAESYEAYLVGMDRELEELRNLIIQHHTCLFTDESDPCCSHRLKLAEKLKKKFDLTYVDINHAETLAKKYSPKAMQADDLAKK
ncbi:DUF488 domain-containing protein [Methanooceanicella nereidis]|nr:DUF488 domain-containing protein [Methanocella sp. CWC-04]